ncbi:MAG: insulinase family protein [bacterium]|nr:insulinase family protein [Candidatus Limimorpha caballi]MCQ2315389.1 insulinase family protein [Bacteroidales bacterium]
MTDGYLISQHILRNGIKLLHRRRAGEVSHLALMVNAGMRDENADENGLAHFIEHLVFKGTKRRKAYHILSCLENVGGDLNAYTTKEETCIHASFLKEHLGKAMDLFADVVFNSTFPENEMEKEKEVILDEINSYRDTPSDEIFDEFENLLYRGHQLGRNILGTIDLVSNYTRDDIVRFHKSHYAPDRMILACIGDISFEDFKRMAEKHFADCRGDAAPFNRIPFVTPPSKIQVEERTSHLTHVVIGGLAYPYNDSRKLKMILLNNILGGPGMNTRLNLNIRERYGFAYTIESQYNAYSDTGNYTIYMGVDPHSQEKSIELVFKELNKLMTQKLGTLQLSNAKRQLVGQAALSNESGMNELLGMTRAGFFEEHIETLPETIAKLDSITAEELIEVANEVFERDKASLLIYKGQ